MVEHQSTEFKGLRFDSSWGLRSFSLSHVHDKMKKMSFSISLLSSKLTIFLNLFTKHDNTINVADSTSMQYACHM